MSVESRLSEVERRLAVGKELPASIPESWVAFGPDGQHVGPPPGVEPSAAERAMLNTLAGLDGAVPAATVDGYA
jgi:hypothetical protein